MSDFIINLGKKKESTIYDTSKFQGEISDKNINDAKYKSIFLQLSNNKNVLTKDDIEQLNEEIKNADSDENGILSDKEAKSLIKKLGLEKIKVKDLYGFLLELMDVASDKAGNNAQEGEIDIKVNEERMIINIPNDMSISLKNKHKNTYLLKNESQLKRLISLSERYKSRLDNDELEKYDDFINKIKYKKNNNIDIEDTGTLKAFLYLRKFVKYKGNIPVNDAPRFNENSQLLGLYASKYNEFRNTINHNSKELEKTKKRQEEMLDELFVKYDIPKEELSNLHIVKSDFANKTFISDTDNEFNDWFLEVLIQKDGYVSEEGEQGSWELITLHELYHVRQTTPGCTEDYSDEFVELGATLDTIIREDELHKLANGIPLEDEVDYPDKIVFKGKTIKVGLIANTFREIMTKYNFETYEEAILSKEGQTFIREHFSK